MTGAAKIIIINHICHNPDFGLTELFALLAGIRGS
jgi:hypothetical protein